MAELWPWLALVGLGLFHGLNPAMGWLFAVALGLHRGGRRTVLVSLVPIALGHAAAVLAALLAVLLLTLIALLAAGPLMKLVGARVETVITRLLGVLLAALAAQYVFDGIRGSFGL